MNGLFHLGSALAALALAWALMRVQRQRDTLRRLAFAVAGAGQEPRAVEIASPRQWLGAFGGALGIPLDLSDTYDLPPRRVRGWVLFELFLSRTITLIRCSQTDTDLLIEIKTARPCPDEAVRATIEREAAAALGERVAVRLIH